MKIKLEDNLLEKRGETLLHIHNPKSAGSMFNSLLSNNLGNGYIADRSLVSYTKHSKTDMENLLYLYPYQCFSSHNFCLKNIPQNAGNIYSISFARNPLDKFISSYFYLKNRKMTADWHHTKNLSIGEVIDYAIETGSFHPFLTDSSQIGWISGTNKNGFDLIKKAVNKNELLLLVTERFDESCVILEKLFPQFFHDCSYANRVNKSNKDGEITVEEHNKIESLDWVQEDFELVKFANKKMDQIISEKFSKDEFVEKLSGFKIRCDLKGKKSTKGVNSPWSIQKKILWRLEKIFS